MPAAVLEARSVEELTSAISSRVGQAHDELIASSDSLHSALTTIDTNSFSSSDYAQYQSRIRRFEGVISNLAAKVELLNQQLSDGTTRPRAMARLLRNFVRVERLYTFYILAWTREHVKPGTWLDPVEQPLRDIQLAKQFLRNTLPIWVEKEKASGRLPKITTPIVSQRSPEVNAILRRLDAEVNEVRLREKKFVEHLDKIPIHLTVVKEATPSEREAALDYYSAHKQPIADGLVAFERSLSGLHEKAKAFEAQTVSDYESLRKHLLELSSWDSTGRITAALRRAFFKLDASLPRLMLNVRIHYIGLLNNMAKNFTTPRAKGDLEVIRKIGEHTLDLIDEKTRSEETTPLKTIIEALAQRKRKQFAQTETSRFTVRKR